MNKNIMSKEINKVLKWKQFLNESVNNISVDTMKRYLLKGITNYLYAHKLGKNIKSLINHNDIPYILLAKTVQYADFEKMLLSKYGKKGYLRNVPIGDFFKDFSTCFYGYYKYYFFGVFGIISILGIDEIKTRIPYFNNLMDFLNELPELTGNYEKDILLYDSFNKKMKDKAAPLKEVGLLIGTRFRDEFINLVKMNDKELYGEEKKFY